MAVGPSALTCRVTPWRRLAASPAADSAAVPSCVSFRAVAEGKVLPAKKSVRGQAERLALLCERFPGALDEKTMHADAAALHDLDCAAEALADPATRLTFALLAARTPSLHRDVLVLVRAVEAELEAVAVTWRRHGLPGAG